MHLIPCTYHIDIRHIFYTHIIHKRALYVSANEPHIHPKCHIFHMHLIPCTYLYSTRTSSATFHAIRFDKHLQKSPLYIRKRALHTSAKEPYIHPQKSPIYIRKRALYTSAKEPYTCTYLMWCILHAHHPQHLMNPGVYTPTKEPYMHPQKSRIHVRIWCNVFCKNLIQKISYTLLYVYVRYVS